MSALTFGPTMSDPELLPPVELMPWQRDWLEREGIDSAYVERLLASAEPEPPAVPIPADPPPVKPHGDPTLGGSGLLIPIDADCPHCGWPERTFDTRSRRFGCIKCTYTSDERNA